jgi:hypothetical protein
MSSMEDNINTKTKIHFRKGTDGSVVEVTEINTKITYITNKEHRVGRFVVTYTRPLYRQTAKARYHYFMYNNRIARFKRAVFPALQRFADRFGVKLYTVQ